MDTRIWYDSINERDREEDEADDSGDLINFFNPLLIRTANKERDFSYDFSLAPIFRPRFEWVIQEIDRTVKKTFQTQSHQSIGDIENEKESCDMEKNRSELIVFELPSSKA